jgi:hypothetical protein
MGWGIINAVAAVNYLTLPNQPSGLQVAGIPSLSNVTIRWTTIREENNQGFEIQRSANTPQNFSPLPGGFVPGAGNSNSTQSYSYTDTTATVGRWHYRLRQINLDGSSTLSNSIEVVVDLPTTFFLFQNYPNPFNPSTTIEYNLPEQSAVHLEIYDALGQRVRTLVNAVQAANTYATEWNGLNDAGVIVATGPYYYRLIARSLSDGRILSTDKKMLFLR